MFSSVSPHSSQSDLKLVVLCVKGTGYFKVSHTESELTELLEISADSCEIGKPVVPIVPLCKNSLKVMRYAVLGWCGLLGFRAVFRLQSAFQTLFS